MLVKVQKIGNAWFRCDNGSLIGREIPPGDLESLKSFYGDKFLLKNDKNIIIVYHGYFDKQGRFNHFCKKSGTDCSICNEYIKNTFCPHVINPKKETGGFYVKTTD